MNEQYEKFEVIGSGRHTVVYEGHDHGPLDRAVAIKELSAPANQDRRKLDAFLAEAKFLANLDYEHLLKVYDVDQESNLVITELLEGSLADLVKKRGPMSSDRVRSVMQQVLKALNYLHKKNLLYGKVRPSKLLFSDRGKVKLSCFEQIDGGIVPKPEDEKYVAPETLATEFGEIGPPLDFYCLGFSALELLLGEKFDEVFPVISGDNEMSSVAWLRWHSSPDPMPPVKKLVPRVADDLAAALDAMLKKPVAERPQSAFEIFELLRDIDPIPVIDGVEQSISLGGRRGRPSLKKEMAPPSKSIELPRDRPAAGPDKQKTAATGTGSKPAKAKSSAKPQTKKTAPAKAPLASADAAPANRAHGQPAKKKRGVVGKLLNAIVLLLLLGGIGFGGWWTYTNDPFNWFTPPVPAAMVAVSFEFEPADVGSVEVIKDGDPMIVDSDGKWHLPVGDHLLEFRAGEYEATMKCRIDENSNSFAVALTKKAVPVEPGEFEVKFTVDPADAKFVIDGQTVATSNGFASAKFADDRQGEKVVVAAEHPGYQPYRNNLELNSTQINHIALDPLLIVKPVNAQVKLGGTLLEKLSEGLFLLPRSDVYQLVVSHDGYTSFENAQLTFDKLKAQKFTIELAPDIDNVFRLGKQALGEEKHTEAIEHFSVVLEHDHAKYLVAFLLRAKAHLGRDADEEDHHHAIEDLTAFLGEADSTAIDSEKAEAYLLRARINSAEEHIDEAIVDYRAAGALQPEDATKRELANLLLDRANKSLTAEQLDPAIADFEEARKLDPSLSGIDSKLAEARYVRGQQKLKSRNLGAAKGDFDRAVSLVDKEPKYFVARAECNGSFSEFKKGIEDYSTAIGLSDAPSPDWYVGRASLYRKIDETQNALADLNKSIQLAPTEPVPYVIRGTLYRDDLKQFSDAISDFRSALQHGFTPPFEINLAIGETYTDAGRAGFSDRKFNKAITQLNDALKQYKVIESADDLTAEQKSQLAERVPGTYRLLGDCYYASKDYPQGIEQYTIAIERSGDRDHVSRARRGNCLKFQGQFDEAEKDLRRALEIDNSYTIVRYYIAQLFVKSGDEKAKRRFSVAAQEQEQLKANAISDYKTAIGELETLIAADQQTRYFDLIIAAWKQLNVIDTSEENANQIKAWAEKKREHLSKK